MILGGSPPDRRHAVGRVWTVDGRETGAPAIDDLAVIVSVARSVTDWIRAEGRLSTILDTMPDAVVIIGPDNTNTYANAAMSRIYGHQAADIRNTPTQERIHPDDVGRALEARLAAEASPGTTIRLRLRVKHASGHFVQSGVSITDLEHDESIGGVLTTLRDLTEEIRSEKALADSERTARFLADNATDALLRLDAHRTIVFASQATSSLLELAPEDIVGAPFLELFTPADRPIVTDAIDVAVESGVVRGREVRALCAAHSDVRWVEVTLRAVVVPVKDSYAVEFHVTLQDVSERRAARLALAASERRMRTLVTAAPVGIFEVDIDDGVTFVNPRFCEITGIASPEHAMGGGWLLLIHPDDSRHVRDAWTAALERTQSFRQEFRFLTPCGKTVWVHVEAVAVVDDDGHVASYLGTVDDVTERRELEQARFEAAELFSAAFDNAPTGIVLTSIDGSTSPRLLKANAAYVGMTGRTFDEILALDIYSITHPDDVDGVRAGRAAIIDGAAGSHHMEARQRHGDGRWRWYSITRSAVRDVDGSLRFMVAQLEDITDRKEAHEQARLLAVTDPLTGLANRRHFLDRLAGASIQESVPEIRLAVAFIDLDHFKTVNDELGHEAGDQLLEEVAEALTRAVRPGDTVARLGGDEFSIVVDRVTDDEIHRIAERLHGVIDFVRALPDGRTHHVTASIGVAVTDAGSGMEPALLLRRADEAMYRAKQLGRHAWVIADCV